MKRVPMQCVTMTAGRWLVVAAILCASLVASCAANLLPPKLTMANVAMTSADIFNQQFLITVHVVNPNDKELPIKQIDYEIFLEGDHFAKGNSVAPFVVPALGETDFDMTVQTTFVSSMGRLIQRLNGRTKIQYAIEGHLRSDVPGAKNLPFKDSGAVDLKVMR